MPRKKRTETTSADAVISTAETAETQNTTDETLPDTPVKKPRGRKKKAESAAEAVVADSVTTADTPVKKRRGRKKKTVEEVSDVSAVNEVTAVSETSNDTGLSIDTINTEITAETVTSEPVKRKRGRKKKAEVVAETDAPDNIPTTETLVKKTRGRKKKSDINSVSTDFKPEQPVKISETFTIQYGSDDYVLHDIKNAVMADFESKMNDGIVNVTDDVSSIEYYIKPEDKAVYYVVKFRNSEFNGKVLL